MTSQTRSIIAASAFAIVTGKKAAGLYDHAEARDVRIAAECREGRLQGVDGERSVMFGGALPEVLVGDRDVLSITSDDAGVRVYDRTAAAYYTVQVNGGVVQVFDHAASAWFTYDVQDPQAPSNYHRAG